MSQDDKRQPDTRSSVMIRATIVDDCGNVSEHRVRNISTSGARVDHDGNLRANIRVQVAVGMAQPCEADMVWVTDTAAGLHFDRPLDLVAARKPRGTGGVHSGWLAEAKNAYR
ncbi:MAG: PilZ domain-containing protein [Alphaproteobacteria bacterium HGW-Alphaproteobacteria-16]|nr:MAG: PilZ domain-containing protein [Alphaproteobacteria bacterium HGW-Alphaproteobacteria-16]